MITWIGNLASDRYTYPFIFIVFVISTIENMIFGGGVVCGAQRFNLYLPYISGKKVGIVASYASQVNGVNIVDTLLRQGVDIRVIFAPEHGFRKLKVAGEHIADTVDISGIPVISLYGTRYAPPDSIISQLDVVIYDLQDVGVRCYTFISTLFYVMDAAARHNKLMIVLDRPNPNGYLIDGPMLNEKFKSFVGIVPVPLVYGMTVGELALMINGEGYLPSGRKSSLIVVPMEGYDRCRPYPLDVMPSPGLVDTLSVWMYPHLVLFEGTKASVGKGTDKSFKIVRYKSMTMSFGYEYFVNISKRKQLNIELIIQVFRMVGRDSSFFTPFFDKLAGNDTLRKMIMEGRSASQIRKSWEDDINKFREKRKKYLLYPDC